MHDQLCELALDLGFIVGYPSYNYERFNFADRHPHIAVAEIGGVSVGYSLSYDAGGVPDEGAPLPLSFYWSLTGVLPEFRRRHVLAAIKDDLFNEAERRGHDRVTVVSYSKFPAMLGALARFGFERISVTGGPVQDDAPIRFQKLL